MHSFTVFDFLPPKILQTSLGYEANQRTLGNLGMTHTSGRLKSFTVPHVRAPECLARTPPLEFQSIIFPTNGYQQQNKCKPVIRFPDACGWLRNISEPESNRLAFHSADLLQFSTTELPPDQAQVENAVKIALQTGYRHLDCAAVYQDEAAVGRAIKTSGVPREEIFV